MSTKMRPINIWVSEEEMLAADEAARKAGHTRSAWIAALIRAALPPETRRQLPSRPGRGRPRKTGEPQILSKK